MDAIVLAGGRSRRMQGHDKLAVLLGGAPIVARVVMACAAAPAVQQLVVPAGKGAGAVALRSRLLAPIPAELRERMKLVADAPTLDGPVAGLAAALEVVTAPIVLVVAGDMPFLTPEALGELVRVLDEAAEDEVWLAMAVDASGRHQFACSAWRRERLSELLAAARSTGGGGRGIPLKALVRPVVARGLARLVELPEAKTLLDVDDPTDLQRARRLEESGSGD